MAPSRNTKKNKNTNSNVPSQEEVQLQEDSASRQNESMHREERHEEEEEVNAAGLLSTLNTFSATQREIIETMKELISSISTKNSQEARDKNSQEESAAAAAKGSEQKGPDLEHKGPDLEKTKSFVTQEDVVAMLERELRRTNEDWKYLPQPPYSVSLINRPYPKGYETPNFILFDGRKGSPREHISRFIDALGPHAGDHNLRLREFSKTLNDRAYTWYTTLAPGSIRTWEEMASKFCKKYFEHEERVTISQLNSTRQGSGENLVEFVRRFRDLALDCYDEKGEEALVEICIGNMLPEYRVYLENVNIDTFSRLMDAVKKTSMSVKVVNGHRASWRSENKDVHQTLVAEDCPQNNNKRKERDTYPAVPCNDEEFHAILDTMFADGVIKPPRPYKNPSREDRTNPCYCRYHQIVGHPSTACQTLRKILHGKIHDGTLELPSKKQTIDEDPLPRRRQGKESAAIITCLNDNMEEEDSPRHVPYLVTEPREQGLDLVSWFEYSKPRGYDTPWSCYSEEEWKNGYIRETSAWIDHHMGASSDEVGLETVAVTLEEHTMERCYTHNKKQRSYPTASQVIQQNPKFKSLFDQLEYGPQARQAAAEALMRISAEYGHQSFVVEASNNRAFLENHNAITFTEEDMVAPYADNRRPLYLETHQSGYYILMSHGGTPTSPINDKWLKLYHP